MSLGHRCVSEAFHYIHNSILKTQLFLYRVCIQTSLPENEMSFNTITLTKDQISVCNIF